MNEQEVQGSEVTSESPADESISEQAVEGQETQAQETAIEQSAEVETQEISQDPPVGIQEEVDAIGVPWKNRAMEAQRKLEKVNEQYNTILERLDQTQSQKKEGYSIEELESFASTTEDESHRLWAQKEIRKLEREEGAKVVRQEIDRWKTEQQSEQMKQDTLQTVMQRYPEAFAKDANGRMVGWNNNSQLAMRIGQYMQNPEIANSPRGLLAAAALAYSDINQVQSARTQAKTTQLKTEVKNLQKKTLIEGSGMTPQQNNTTPLSSARQKLSETGSIKDGAQAFKEILKSSGRIKE